MKLPIRDRNRILERNSRLFLESKIPEGWTTTAPVEDYGVDLTVNIFENTHPVCDFDVQLKASEKSIIGDFEKAILKVRTYNFLKHKLHIVILIKYCEEDKEAYWILLSDIDKPEQLKNTFTVKISKENKLFTIDWNSVREYIKDIVDYKLLIGDEIKKIIKKI